MAYDLPDLPYDYEALQPYMSKETLEFHHDKHHKAYLDAMTPMIQGSKYETMSLEEVVKTSHSDDPKLFNQVGQYYNHVHFWNWIAPNGGGKSLPGGLQKAVDSDLGGYDQMRADFIEAGKTQFGSGWAWIAVKNGKLEIMKTPNGENPLVHGAHPILGCDVWEHSYYIDYRNARPKYLEAFIDNLVNWEHVEKMYGEASG